MKQLGALLFLLLIPAGAQAYFIPNFEPKDLAQADTILFTPVTSIHERFSPDVTGAITGPVKATLDVTTPLALLGHAGPAEHIAFTDYDYPYLANKTAELIFLRRNGATLEPIGQLGWAVGVTGDPTALATTLRQAKPSAWSILAQCFIFEKDPACALHLSYILCDAPPNVLQTTWDAVKDRKNSPPDLRLACQNIGLRAVGVSALDGFVEPGVNKDPSSIDKDGSLMARYELVNPMVTWLYYGRDTEDFHHLLAFARNQRGRVGEAAICGTQRLTQKNDLPQLLDIFEHAPAVGIRYACLEHFYNILGHPDPSEIPGFDVFKKHESKYARIWKERVAVFDSRT